MAVTAPDIVQIPMSSELAVTIARGIEFAGAMGASEVSLEHLLAALCDDPDAGAVLDASHISGEQIKGDAISRVLENGQQAPTPRDSPSISVEMRRIFAAAAAAARGSCRRDINGAIVLAAIVGDAKSVAAEILKAYGLTFKNAIRALQIVLASPREAPPQPQPQSFVTDDDVLACASECVQSRSALPLREVIKDMPRPAPPELSAPMPEIQAAHQPPVPEQPVPEPLLPYHVPVPEPPFPEIPSPLSKPAGPVTPALDHDEPFDPPVLEMYARDIAHKTWQSGMESPYLEPCSSPVAAETTPSPARPFSTPSAPPKPRLLVGGESNKQQRSGPSFGVLCAAHASEPGSHPAPVPAPDHAKVPFRPKLSSLPHPSRPAQQQPWSGGCCLRRQEWRVFSLLFPPTGAPQSAAPGICASPRSIEPAPLREMFDSQPRPQPSQIPPPPVPHAPGLGSPAEAKLHPAEPLPAQSGSLQFGTLGPSLSVDSQSVPSSASSQRPKRGKAANIETGQLTENIPRTMRVEKTVHAEVRISKASVRALTEGMDGSGQVWQHAAAVAKAMSVRIRALDGGFFIESTSPETQWIENTLGYESDDFASWCFLITPQSRGWLDLQIIVSARTIAADGVAAETAFPGQIVEVEVRANIGHAIARLFSWTAAAIAGGTLATFEESGMTIATALLKKFGY